METLLYGLTEYGYIGLFIASFLAATILPFSSEIVFTTLLYAVETDVYLCIFAATLGNFLGGMSCYYLGYIGKIEWIERYLRVKEETLKKWNRRLQKHASWFAFFSFLPGIGDIIALAAGFLHANVWITSIAMLLGKFLRYLLWVWATYWIFQ